MIERAENVVKVRCVILKFKGAVEKFLGGHGKKLGFVRCTIGVKKGFMSLLGEMSQPQIFSRADGNPFVELVAIGDDRSAVGGSVKHIKLVESSVDSI